MTANISLLTLCTEMVYLLPRTIIVAKFSFQQMEQIGLLFKFNPMISLTCNTSPMLTTNFSLLEQTSAVVLFTLPQMVLIGIGYQPQYHIIPSISDLKKEKRIYFFFYFI